MNVALATFRSEVGWKGNRGAIGLFNDWIKDHPETKIHGVQWTWERHFNIPPLLVIEVMYEEDR